ncbi:MAG: ribonuclease H-like domain-containing protein [Kiritimatiellae bacterium]|nr:ribonuclease H-like domain-containing protein [Kiritimatiellia bacterium]
MYSWDDLGSRGLAVLGPRRMTSILQQLDTSRTALAAHDWKFFLERLQPLDRARLLPHIREEVAYLDIETTGLTKPAVVTAIALYDGFECRSYVRGENLDQFLRDATAYRVLVTYNGRLFDIPFLEREFGVSFNHAHIDLCPVMRACGLRGGLKVCERAFGIERQVAEEITGYFAVVLWHIYERLGDEKALSLLKAYNLQDALSLEALLVEAYNQSMARHPVAVRLTRPPPPKLCNVPSAAEFREIIKSVSEI